MDGNTAEGRRSMFERFGEFDSYEEINRAAEGLKEEGDIESLKVLAEENGLDPEDAEDYMNDNLYGLFCNEIQAALGKIKVECEELKPKDLMEDWVDYLQTIVMDESDIAQAVRKKGKSLAGVMAALLKWSFAHQHDIPEDIKKAAGVSAGKVTFGIPCMADAKHIIREYYLGGGEK